MIKHFSHRRYNFSVSVRLAAMYVAITLLLAYPLSQHPGSQVISAAPDTDLFMWTLAWDAHAFRHPVSLLPHIFDANIYAPQRLTLAYSENLIGSAFIAAPVLWTTGNPVLAMNAVSLVSTVLCAIGAWWLARRVGVSREGAILAGLVYAFSPPRFLRLDQIHLVAMQWIPFALAAFHGYLGTGRRRDLWLATLFFTLEVLSSGHGAVFLSLALLFVFAWHVTVGGGRLDVLARARDFGWPGALALAPVFLSLIPYFIVQRETGLRRTLEDWAVPATSFLASPAHAWVALLSLFPNAQVNETAGAYLFPGLLPIALALAGLFWPVRAGGAASPALRWCYALITLVAFWLAAGPPIGIWPFVYWLPGLNFIRAPNRFVLLAIAGLAVLAGIGFDRLSASTRRRGVLAAALGLLLVGEFAAVPLGTEAYSVQIPAIDRWLATQPGPMTIAEVPLPDSRDLNRRERRQTLFMLHSTAHWQKTVHGYSGIRPPQYDELYAALLHFPDEDSLSRLRRLGATHVVVHQGLYEEGEFAQVRARLDALRDRLPLVHEESGDAVYALVAARD